MVKKEKLRAEFDFYLSQMENSGADIRALVAAEFLILGAIFTLELPAEKIEILKLFLILIAFGFIVLIYGKYGAHSSDKKIKDLLNKMDSTPKV